MNHHNLTHGLFTVSAMDGPEKEKHKKKAPCLRNKERSEITAKPVVEGIESQGRGGKDQKGKMRGHHLHQLLFTIWENRGKMTPVLTSAPFNLTPLPSLPWGSVGSTSRIGVGGSWLIQVATIGANLCLIHTLAHNSKDDPSLD